MLGKLALVTVSLVAAAVNGLPTTTPSGDMSTTAEVDASPAAKAIGYVFYRGDGSIGQGWPSKDAWRSYRDLWNINVSTMKASCVWSKWGANDSDDEASAIDRAIQELSSSTGVDNRLILAIVMQESKGCVRAPTTTSRDGVRNPGLMQSHNGSGSCAGRGGPCPASEIRQMIRDGTARTSTGDGLRQVLNQALGTTRDASMARTAYLAARIYNSGSANTWRLVDGRGSTACYASDIANRVRGWVDGGNTCR